MAGGSFQKRRFEILLDGDDLRITEKGWSGSQVGAKRDPKVAAGAASPQTFEIECDTTRDMLGMCVDLRGATVMILAIGPGEIERHNRSSEAAKRVQPNDFILEVNGNADPEAIMAGLTAKGKVRLKVRRVLPFRAVVLKRGKDLGMQLAYLASGASISITALAEGAVVDYNRDAPPDAQIKVQDRIMSVCGVSDDAAKMAEALRSFEAVDMMIARVIEP